MLAVPGHLARAAATEACATRKIFTAKSRSRAPSPSNRPSSKPSEEQSHLADRLLAAIAGAFRKAAEIVRNGLIGKVTRVEVGLPSGHHDFAGTEQLAENLAKLPRSLRPGQGPSRQPGLECRGHRAAGRLDYEIWLGPSQMEPYIKARVHMNWRWNYNIGGGQLLDWIGHHCDIAHWGLDCDQRRPVRNRRHWRVPAEDAIWNTCTKYRITCKYPERCHDDYCRRSRRHQERHQMDRHRRLGLGRSRRLSTRPTSIGSEKIPADKYKVKLYRSDNHQANFIDCVKSRQPTITPGEVAHHSAIPGPWPISMMVGRKIKWDAANEVILGDDEASKLLSRPVPRALEARLITKM